MSKQAVAELDALWLYKSGNNIFWELDELNNIDKHRLILTVGACFRASGIEHHHQSGLFYCGISGVSNPINMSK